jgi:hypothetical protein
MPASSSIADGAEPVVGETDAVPRVRDAVHVADLLEQRQRAFAVRQRGPVVAELGGAPADRVAQRGDALLVIVDLHVVQALAGVPQRGLVVAAVLVELGERPVQRALPAVVAEPAGDRHRGAEIPFRVVQRAEPQVRAAQPAVRVVPAVLVAEGQRGVEPDPLDREVLLIVPAPVEVAVQRPGEVPGRNGEPGGRAPAGRAREDLPLRVEPGDGVGVVVDGLRLDAVRKRGEQRRLATGVEALRRGDRGVYIVDGDAVQRRPPLLRVVGGPRQLAGVRAEQVVEREPARPVLADQVQAGQFGEQGPHPRGRRTGERGRGGQRDVGTRVHAEEAEQPGRRRAEKPVRPREHRPGAGGAVARVERVEPPGGFGAGVGELVGEPGQRKRRVRRRAGADSGQRERQAGAPLHDDARGVGVAGHPSGTEVTREQFVRHVGAEQAERDEQRAVGGQAGELASARHQHQAAGRTRQQRPDLVGVAGVVEQHEHPPAGERAAVQRRLRVEVTGRSGDAERGEQAADRLDRTDRLARGVELAQVEVQLAVGEVGRHPLREVQRQRALADPGGAAHRADRDGGGLGDELCQQRQFGRAVHEMAPGGRQLPGNRRRGARTRALLGQQPGVHVADVLAGLDPQPVGERAPHAPVRGERLGAPPGPREGQQQQPPRPFPVRIGGDHVFQRRHEIVVAIRGEAQLRPGLRHVPAPLVQALRGVGEHRYRQHAGERRTAPQRQRRRQFGDRGGNVAGRGRRATGRRPVLEHRRVDVVGRHREPVPVRHRTDDRTVAVGDQPAQPPGVVRQHLPRRVRRIDRPYRVDQPVAVERFVAAAHEDRQQRPHLGRGERDRTAVDRRLDRPQDPKTHPVLPRTASHRPTSKTTTYPTARHPFRTRTAPRLRSTGPGPMSMMPTWFLRTVSSRSRPSASPWV